MIHFVQVRPEGGGGQRGHDSHMTTHTTLTTQFPIYLSIMVEAAHNDYSALWKAQAESKSGGDHSYCACGQYRKVIYILHPQSLQRPSQILFTPRLKDSGNTSLVLSSKFNCSARKGRADSFGTYFYHCEAVIFKASNVVLQRKGEGGTSWKQ